MLRAVVVLIAVASCVAPKKSSKNSNEIPKPTPELHTAAQAGDVKSIRNLIKRGAKPETPFSKNDETPLHWAAQAGKHEAIKVLVELGAPINAKTKQIQTPLHVAVHGDLPQVDTVEALIALGADLTAKGPQGATALHFAAIRGHDKIVKMLLKAGAPVDVLADSQTMPLHWAAQGGSQDSIEALVDAGAPLEVMDGKGDTPLQVAKNNKQADAEYVLKRELKKAKKAREAKQEL